MALSSGSGVKSKAQMTRRLRAPPQSIGRSIPAPDRRKGCRTEELRSLPGVHGRVPFSVADKVALRLLMPGEAELAAVVVRRVGDDRRASVQGYDEARSEVGQAHADGFAAKGPEGTWAYLLVLLDEPAHVVAVDLERGHDVSGNVPLNLGPGIEAASTRVLSKARAARRWISVEDDCRSRG